MRVCVSIPARFQPPPPSNAVLCLRVIYFFCACIKKTGQPFQEPRSLFPPAFHSLPSEWPLLSCALRCSLHLSSRSHDLPPPRLPPSNSPTQRIANVERAGINKRAVQSRFDWQQGLGRSTGLFDSPACCGRYTDTVSMLLCVYLRNNGFVFFRIKALSRHRRCCCFVPVTESSWPPMLQV